MWMCLSLVVAVSVFVHMGEMHSDYIIPVSVIQYLMQRQFSQLKFKKFKIMVL